MIAKLTGTVDAVGADEIVLDVGGVGYLVACGSKTLARLPAPGQTVSLHIQSKTREDGTYLYGFATEEERAWFERLQDIQGVGPKAAMAVLDVLSPGELMRAAADDDKALVARAHGVGPRLAARIVTELKDKPAPATRYGGVAGVMAAGRTKTAAGGNVEASAEAEASDFKLRDDAVSALKNLGLQEPEARAAVLAALGGFDAPPKLDALLKAALKELGR